MQMLTACIQIRSHLPSIDWHHTLFLFNIYLLVTSPLHDQQFENTLRLTNGIAKGKPHHYPHFNNHCVAPFVFLQPHRSNMYTKRDQIGVAQAVAHNLDISQVLNAKAYHLSNALNLVNVRKSGITCLGKCTNGGTCQRHIAKEYAIKGLLGVMRAVFDSSIQGEDLEACLEMKFMHLLCTQDHKDGAQAAACSEDRIEAVEEFRIAHGIESLQQHNHYRCHPSVQDLEPDAGDPPSPVDWKAAYEARSAKYSILETEKEYSEQEVVCLQYEIKALHKEMAGMDKDKKRV
jgi:hypothetical protein